MSVPALIVGNALRDAIATNPTLPWEVALSEAKHDFRRLRGEAPTCLFLTEGDCQALQDEPTFRARTRFCDDTRNIYGCIPKFLFGLRVVLVFA